jgi:hypothetical protein
VRFDATLADGSVTYRAFRSPWIGTPTEPPLVAFTRDASGATAHVSWNGATEVAHWRADVGPARTALRPVATAPKHGFETSVALGHRRGFVALVALDAHGTKLGSSVIHRLA